MSAAACVHLGPVSATGDSCLAPSHPRRAPGCSKFYQSRSFANVRGLRRRSVNRRSRWRGSGGTLFSRTRLKLPESRPPRTLNLPAATAIIEDGAASFAQPPWQHPRRHFSSADCLLNRASALASPWQCHGRGGSIAGARMRARGFRMANTMSPAPTTRQRPVAPVRCKHIVTSFTVSHWPAGLGAPTAGVNLQLHQLLAATELPAGSASQLQRHQQSADSSATAPARLQQARQRHMRCTPRCYHGRTQPTSPLLP